MPLEATLREKRCSVCSVEFKPRSARQEYCSKTCRYGILLCKQCGEHFTPKGNNTSGEFCSRACWYAWPGRIEDRQCPVCKIMFRPHTHKQVTCGYECKDAHSRVARNTNCAYCNKELRKDISPRVRFCSRRCGLMERDNKGTLNAPIGKVTKGSQGYSLIKVGKDYPGANCTGWIQEHRYVMAQILGRPLDPRERVHHRNSKRSDNRPENLELWTLQHKDPPGARIVDHVSEWFFADDEIAALPEEVRTVIHSVFMRMTT